MNLLRWLALALPLPVSACQVDSAPEPARAPRAAHEVSINGVALTESELAEFAAREHQSLPPGDFWYDAMSGAWGLKGGPALGITRAGMRLGGTLRADASGGGDGRTTAVFVNGRELHPLDVAALAQIVRVVPGRYWVDGQGNFGYEGFGGSLGNLYAIATAAQSRGNSYCRRASGGYIGSDGETSYFFDPKSGATVIPGEGVSY